MSLKPCHYPVDRISEIVVRYIGNDFISYEKRSIRSIVDSIYRPESVFWKDYRQRFIDCQQQKKDFVFTSAQSEFFDAIFDLQRDPRLTVSASLSMMKDICDAIEKCKEDGTYTEEQALTISHLLINDFERSVHICDALEKEYAKNRQTVDFCANRKFHFETSLYLYPKERTISEYNSDMKNNKNKRLIVILCSICILFGIIGFLQKIQWMIVVFFIFIGSVVWGLYSDVISPKIIKALTPDPNWDEKTTNRFNNLKGWLIILFLIAVTFILNKLGLLGDVDPEESHLFRAPW